MCLFKEKLKRPKAEGRQCPVGWEAAGQDLRGC